MRYHRSSLVAALASALFAFSPRLLSAQDHPVTAAAISGDTAENRDVAAWVSLGVGYGTLDNSVAAILRANVTYGQYIVTVRFSDVGQFEGPGGVVDRGILVGVRTPDHGGFSSAAVGVVIASPAYCNCGHASGPSVPALAFDLVGHANLIVPGVAVSLSGTIGPRGAIAGAATVTLELGWFGR